MGMAGEALPRAGTVDVNSSGSGAFEIVVSKEFQ